MKIFKKKNENFKKGNFHKWKLKKRKCKKIRYIQCPICLHPPIAAKVGRCGHAHCSSCILKLISISEYPECPICQCDIKLTDLRSVICGVEKRPKLNSTIEFVKMKRTKNSVASLPQAPVNATVSKKSHKKVQTKVHKEVQKRKLIKKYKQKSIKKYKKVHKKLQNKVHKKYKKVHKKVQKVHKKVQKKVHNKVQKKFIKK